MEHAGSRSSIAMVIARMTRSSIPSGSARRRGNVLVTVEGKVPVDGRAPRLDRRVCVAGTDTCSAEMRLPFAGEMPMVEALWLCTDRPEDHLRGVILELEDGERVEVEPRPHMAAEVREEGGVLSIRASLAIHRFRASLVRLRDGEVVETFWRSSRLGWEITPPTTATLRLPAEVRASCADCSLVVQLAHVWRDGEIHEVSEAERTILLGDGEGA